MEKKFKFNSKHDSTIAESYAECFNNMINKYNISY